MRPGPTTAAGGGPRMVSLGSLMKGLTAPAPAPKLQVGGPRTVAIVPAATMTWISAGDQKRVDDAQPGASPGSDTEEEAGAGAGAGAKAGAEAGADAGPSTQESKGKASTWEKGKEGLYSFLRSLPTISLLGGTGEKKKEHPAAEEEAAHELCALSASRALVPVRDPDYEVKRRGRGAHAPVPVIHVDESYPGRGSDPPIALPEPVGAIGGGSLEQIAAARLREKRKLARLANRPVLKKQRRPGGDDDDGDAEDERLNWLEDDSDDEEDEEEDEAPRGSPGRAQPHGDESDGADVETPRALRHRRYRARLQRLAKVEAEDPEPAPAAPGAALEANASNAMILYRPKITNLNMLLNQAAKRKRGESAEAADPNAKPEDPARGAAGRRRGAKAEEILGQFLWEDNVHAPIRCVPPSPLLLARAPPRAAAR